MSELVKKNSQIKDWAIFANLYLAADGVTDDAANLLTALTAAAGRKLVFPHRSTVKLATPVVYTGSINIELNGSRIIAPNRALHVQRLREYKDTGSTSSYFFSVTKGGRSFSIPSGWGVQTGDFLALRSTDVYEASGSNRYGHLATVLSVSGGVAYLSHPFADSFSVNIAEIYDGITGKIENGVIDQSGAADPGTYLSTSVIQDCVLFKGATFDFANLQLLGNDYTATGLQAQATVIRGKKSHAHGHANVTGYGTGGRNGYGILVHGQDVVLDQCGGSNCKHVLMTGSRDFIGGKVTFSNPVVWHNTAEWNVTVQPQSGTQSKWGAPIDSHAGVSEFNVIDPIVTGGNALINLRNRRAKVVRPVLHHFGSRATPADAFVISAYEGPIELHQVIDPVLYLNVPGDLTGAGLPYLYGIAAFGANQDHGTVQIKNPRFVSGGGVFGTYISQGSPVNNTCTIKSVEVTGISGYITDGVRVASILQGGSDQHLWEKISRITVSCDDVEFVSKYGKTDGQVLTATDVSDIDEIVRVTGRAKVFPGMTASVAAVSVGEQSKTFKMPALFDFSGFRVEAPFGGIYVRGTDTRSINRFVCDGMEIIHALNELGSGSAHGLTLEHGATLGSRATFAGARIVKNGNTSATNASAVNANGNNVDLSGAVVEGATPDIGSLANFPIGLRNVAYTPQEVLGIGGSEIYYVAANGRIQCNTTPPTRFSGIPAGTRVQRLTATTSGAQEWMFTGSGWVAVLTL